MTTRTRSPRRGRWHTGARAGREEAGGRINAGRRALVASRGRDRAEI